MNRDELVRKIANENHLTQKSVNQHLDAFIDAVEDALLDGDYVNIYGFIKFEILTVNERSGIVNVGKDKGKVWTVPQHRKLRIKAHTDLNNCVR